MSENGPWKIDVSRLVLTPEVRRAVVRKLNNRRSPVFHKEPRQIRFLASIAIALEVARIRSGPSPNRDAPGFKRINKLLDQLQKEFSKLTPWQRAEFDLAADHEARAWLRARRKETAEPVVEAAEDAFTAEVHESSVGESREEIPNTTTDEVPSAPRTILGRVGVERFGEGRDDWRPSLSSDYLLDHYQWSCGIFAAAANHVVASYAELPPQHKYVGPPSAVIHLITLVGQAWKREFGQEPNDDPNGAFGEVVNELISELGIFKAGKNIGAKSLKRALKS